MIDHAPLFLSGLLVGVIIFQTAIIAPTVFIGLGADHAGPFLRKIFPKFFVLIAIVSLINSGLAMISGHNFYAWIGVISCGLACVSYALIPMTNKSRDEGNDKVFKRLHNASVAMTVMILLGNISSLFA